ncbi:MAG: hypothetical protein H6974_14710 [Gammaproteobacteria bacterium]|nr:hypothetical protein [Gammaproteobacteria bacterium]MCP5198012.1 hypothetical protein [Gammaproteobacteria bacterium]
MHTNTEELYKTRTIPFCRFHPDPEQVRTAAVWLRNVAGIESVRQTAPLSVEVTYDLRQVTLACIERALSELGYHLDNSLLCKLKRALFHYTEDTQRENLAIVQECQITQQEVFINRYQHLAHGCRDPQPEYWREYQ